MSILKNIFQKKEEIEIETPQEITESISEEISAAISAAIFLYKQEVHIYENTVLTIKRIDRIYSPWSSKIYGLTKNPRN